jgi:hypothetical protein
MNYTQVVPYETALLLLHLMKLCIYNSLLASNGTAASSLAHNETTATHLA